MSIESKAVMPRGNDTRYPCLMASASKVVLFTEPGKGTVVWSEKGQGGSRVGCHSDDWIMSMFSPFQGEISLKNKE